MWSPITKRKEIVMWIHIYPNWKMNFNSKNGNKRSFSHQTKASISFIPIRRTCLGSSIMKWNEITMWIHVYPNLNTYFNSKIGNKSSFSYEIKALISLIPMGRTCLWCPILNETRLLYESLFIPIERRTSNLKLVTREVFLLKPKHQYH